MDLGFFSLSILILKFCSVLVLFLCRWDCSSSLGILLLVCFVLVLALDLSTICFVVFVVFGSLRICFDYICELLMVLYFFGWILCYRLVVFLGRNIVIVLGIVVWLVDVDVFVVFYWRLDGRSLCMEMGDIFVAVIICFFIIFIFRTSAEFSFLISMVLVKELIFGTISWSVRIFVFFLCIDSVCKYFSWCRRLM